MLGLEVWVTFAGLLLAFGLWLIMDELVSPQKEILKEYLHYLQTGKDRVSENLSVRFLTPILGKLTVLGKGLSTKFSIEAVQKDLVEAGWRKITPEVFFAFRIGAAIVGFFVGGALGAIIATYTGGLIGSILGVIVGWFFPQLQAKDRARVRKENIIKSLPSTLDLLTVSAEAGLPFLGAVSKVCEKLPGTFSEELNQSLYMMEAGKSLEESMRDLAYRCGVEEVNKFVSAVLQGSKYGVALADIFRTQSDTVRTQLRQDAEEAAHKAPVKMILPLTVFILPSIFIVLLAPAILKMMQSGM